MRRAVEVGLAMALGAMAIAFKPWGPGLAEGQKAPPSGEKLVTVEPWTRLNAVMITEVTVGGQEVQCGLLTGRRRVQPVAPFQAGSDWLKDMTIYIYNRTNKMIVAGHIVLGFPETKSGRSAPQSAYLIGLGRIPQVDAFDGRTGRPLRINPNAKALAFAPNQTLAIHVGDYISGIEASVANRMPLFYVTKVRIYLGSFCFQDGMVWVAAQYSVPDPHHPGRFVNLARDYFPGDRRQNWPPPPPGVSH